jgi:hypothetical protein
MLQSLNKRIAVAARTFPASSIPLWAMEVRPWLTSCQPRAQAGAGRTSLPLPDSGGGETVGFTITIRPDRS